MIKKNLSNDNIIIIIKIIFLWYNTFNSYYLVKSSAKTGGGGEGTIDVYPRIATELQVLSNISCGK